MSDDHDCRRETCMFHKSNMEMFTSFGLNLKELNDSIHHLEMSMVSAASASKTKATIMGIAITLGIGALGFVFGIAERNDIKVNERVTKLEEVVYKGMTIRLDIQGRVKAIEDDVTELKGHHK